MRTLKTLLLLAVFSMVFFSCKKDDEKSPAEYPFAKETVDQGKAKIEDAGQQLIVEVKAMENSESITVLDAFNEFTSADDPMGSSITKSAPVFRTINAATIMSKSENGLTYLSKMMKSDVTGDPNSFQEVYDKYKGIYTWDLVSKVWIKTTSTEFKFIFPSKKTGTSNDALMVIKYTGKTGIHPIESYDGDLPATFNASILVKDKKVFEIDFKASYNGDGYPTSVNYFIALYPYKYEISWTYSSSSLTLRYHLTNGEKNIVDCFGNVGGNFSKENLVKVNSAMNAEPTDVFYNGNAYFQVLNIKLAGTIDFKNLYNAALKIDETIKDDFKADTALVKEINKYVALDLVYADTKQKIASAEAFPTKSTYTYYDYGLGKDVTKAESEIDMKFVFANGSKDDVEAYFGKGFEQLVNDLNAFIVELNNDYELGLDAVDYGK